MGILYFLLHLVFPKTDKELSWITLSKIVMLFIVRVSELLFNTNSAIFQLYHGENKLIFNDMMMRSALY